MFLEFAGQDALRNSSPFRSCSWGCMFLFCDLAIIGETTLVGHNEVQLQHGLLKPLQFFTERDVDAVWEAMPVIEPSK
jgi:hypothetical protein